VEDRTRHTSKDVENNESKYDTKVSPSLRIEGAYICEEYVCIRYRTELTIRSRIFIEEIAARLIDVCTHILSTGFAGRRIKVQELEKISKMLPDAKSCR
jgi:hypothetical protein